MRRSNAMHTTSFEAQRSNLNWTPSQVWPLRVELESVDPNGIAWFIPHVVRSFSSPVRKSSNPVDPPQWGSKCLVFSLCWVVLMNWNHLSWRVSFAQTLPKTKASSCLVGWLVGDKPRINTSSVCSPPAVRNGSTQAHTDLMTSKKHQMKTVVDHPDLDHSLSLSLFSIYLALIHSHGRRQSNLVQALVWKWSENTHQTRRD